MTRVRKVQHQHNVHLKEVKKSHARVDKAHLVRSDAKVQKLNDYILRAKEWTSAENVKRIIKKYGETKLDRMLMACENIIKVSDDTGLTKGELFKIAKYIETKLPYKVKKGKAYLRKEKTGLARTIEYKSKRAFIHLKTHGVQALGTGCHKKVTRSIMYAAHKPEVVANCVGDKTVKAEGRILQKLNGSDGVVKTYAFSTHKKKSGRKVYSMITKMYNAHTVRSYEYDRSHLENRNEAAYIARDLMLGLENMHAKKLAHRDLHSGNFMVHRTADKVSACLIDFGQVVSFKKAKKMAPKIEVARQLVTPESLLKGKHRVDVRKIESYAVGCSLYHLYFGTTPEWCEKMKQMRVSKLNRGQKKLLSEELSRQMRATIDRRNEELEAGNKKYKKLGAVILKLLDPDPKKRLSPNRARIMLDEVIKEIESKR